MIIAETKTSRKIYRAGIVGCGRIASTFDRDPRRKYVATHAGAYSRIPLVQLAAACDLDGKRLQDFGKTWKVKNLYQDLDSMLEKEHLDILSICTWPGTHYDLAKMAVKRGVRAIFCEKPITDRLNQADELVNLCQQAGVVLAVNHSRRWDTGHAKVKQFLDGGKLGKIHYVSCFYTAGLSNTGTHLFDLLRFFLGAVKSVSASPEPKFGDQDPTLSGEILFESGVLASVVGLDVKDYLIFEIDFYGSKGRLRLTHSGFSCEYWKVGKSPYFSGYQELVASKSPADLREKKMMLNAVQDIVACLKTGKQPLSTGDDGRKTLEIICAFHESWRTGNKIALPLKNRNVGI